MMSKQKQLFSTDFEMHASMKLLFPYLSTPSGLSEWFCTDVTISPEKVLTFRWETETRKAVVAANRPVQFVKFEFLGADGKPTGDPDYLELRMETDDLTQLTYLRIVEYSDFEDQEELQALWEDSVEKLKKVVGG